jgi:hypothetical protein
MTPEPLTPADRLVDDILERMDDLIQLGVAELPQSTIEMLSRSEKRRWAMQAESLGFTLEEVIEDCLKAYAEKTTDSSWMQEIPQEELGKVFQRGGGVQVRSVETMKRRDRAARESA